MFVVDRREQHVLCDDKPPVCHFSGKCANCGLQLRDMLISKEEFAWLFSRAEQLLTEEVQSLEDNEKLQVEVKKLKRMVKQVGPFDVVIDGLNVGYVGQKGFSLDAVRMHRQTH